MAGLELGKLLELVRTERVQAFRFPDGDLRVDVSSLDFGDEPLAVPEVAKDPVWRVTVSPAMKAAARDAARSAELPMSEWAAGVIVRAVSGLDRAPVDRPVRRVTAHAARVYTETLVIPVVWDPVVVAAAAETEQLSSFEWIRRRLLDAMPESVQADLRERFERASGEPRRRAAPMYSAQCSIGMDSETLAAISEILERTGTKTSTWARGLLLAAARSDDYGARVVAEVDPHRGVGTSSVTVLMSTAERDELWAAAKAAGYQFTPWARRILVAALTE